VTQDGELTGQGTLFEHIAEEGNVGGVILDEQKVYARSGNSREGEDALLGLILPSGLAMADNFFGPCEELQRATEGGVYLRDRVPRPLARVLGLLLEVR